MIEPLRETPFPGLNAHVKISSARKLIVTCLSKCLLFLVAAGAMLAPCRGDVLFSERFDYSDGPLTEVSNGVWRKHSGTELQANVLDGELCLDESETEDVNALVGNSTIQPEDGVVLYASFRIRFSELPSASGDYFAHFRSSSFRARIFALTDGAANDQFRIGISNNDGSPNQFLEQDFSLNESYLLVVRYEVANAAATLWLNPQSETDPGAVALDSVGATSINSFAFRQTSGIGALCVDDLIVATTFLEVLQDNNVEGPPQIRSQPKSITANPGADALFEVNAAGTKPLHFQWFLEEDALPDATNATLRLENVSSRDEGGYHAVIANELDSVTSEAALLRVLPAVADGDLTLLTYNVKGNGAEDWSTNAPQVQAIGRELRFIDADIVTLNEIPFDLSDEMTNFMTAFLPEFNLAMNSATDGSVRSAILSRFPVLRSDHYLARTNLSAYGIDGNFTRDLFEAEIEVPEFEKPLHVFTVHLKAFSDEASNQKRGAEASVVSNFFVNALLPEIGDHPYVLTGDFNEDVDNPPATSADPFGRLVNPATGLHLTTPVNWFTEEDFTLSIQDALDLRFDYILPGGILFSNIIAGQVFRTDLLNPLPESLLASDSATASDHLPIIIAFKNPYDPSFGISSFEFSDGNISLQWPSLQDWSYSIEQTSDFQTWTDIATNLQSSFGRIKWSGEVEDQSSYLRILRTR